MNVIDLQNDLSLELMFLSFDYQQKQWGAQFRLRPTIGSTVKTEAQQPDQYNIFDVHFSRLNPDDLPYLDQVMDLKPSEFVLWMKTEYQAWLARPETERQLLTGSLLAIFEYVELNGVKS
jgi:hypothetical protein